MPKQKFDPELVSEMEWSECILACSLETTPTEDERTTTWLCAVCDVASLVIINHTNLSDTAQEFLDKEWRYRRTRKGMDAVCPNCRRASNKI